MRPMRWKQPAPMVCTPAQRRQSNSALLGRQVQIIPDFIILIIYHLFYSPGFQKVPPAYIRRGAVVENPGFDHGGKRPVLGSGC